MREFGREGARGTGRKQRGLSRGKNFGDNGSFGNGGRGRGFGRRNFQNILNGSMEGKQMKVAFMTNGKEHIAKHIGLAKNDLMKKTGA